MSFTATVLNGTIVIPEGMHLDDATEVLIVPQPKNRTSFMERYSDLIGSIETGTGDLAENHDRYLYANPRKLEK